jgi:hypothetical protein
MNAVDNAATTALLAAEDIGVTTFRSTTLTMLVIPDSVATMLRREITTDWREYRGLSYGESRPFPDDGAVGQALLLLARTACSHRDSGDTAARTMVRAVARSRWLRSIESSATLRLAVHGSVAHEHGQVRLVF